MRILLIHAEYFGYEARQKALNKAEELTEKNRALRLENVLVVFTSVEQIDGEALEKIVNKAAEEIQKIAKQLGIEKILVYPYAHLSPTLASPDVALEVLRKLEEKLASLDFKVYRAPFGWYKRFEMRCHGHPLAELSRRITAEDLEKKPTEEYAILTPEGTLHSLEEYDLEKSPKDFRILVEREALKKPSTEAQTKPKYLEYCKKFGIEWEPMSDVGHMRYGPEATIILNLVSQYAWDCVKSIGIPVFEVKGTNTFDLSYKPIKQHAELFGDRSYTLKVGDKKFVLRYAACHQQFAMIKDWVISYRNLPFGAYELADSYRLEQPGELLLCFRMRKFYMPDFHVFTRDVEEAKKVSLKIHEKIYEEIRKLGRDYVSIYNIAKSFLEENKDYVLELVRREGKPVLLHFVPEGKYYWVINIEYNIIDQLDRPREIGTFQIDIGNAKRFGITYTDEKGEKKYPVIIHTAIIGSVERYIYAVLDTAVAMEREGKPPMLPVWLSPIQVRLIPVGEKHVEKCLEIAAALSKRGFRADVDDRKESISKRIRDAETHWIPYIAVIGDREVKEGKLSVRIREEGRVEKLSAENLIEILEEKTKGYPRRELTLPILVSKRPGYR